MPFSPVGHVHKRLSSCLHKRGCASFDARDLSLTFVAVTPPCSAENGIKMAFGGFFLIFFLFLIPVSPSSKWSGHCLPKLSPSSGCYQDCRGEWHVLRCQLLKLPDLLIFRNKNTRKISLLFLCSFCRSFQNHAIFFKSWGYALFIICTLYIYAYIQNFSV